MRPSFLPTIILSTLAISLPASAEENYWYVSAKGGLVFPDEQDFRNQGNLLVPFAEKKGYSISGQIGYNMGRFRLESDVGYQQNKFKSFINSGLAAQDPLGTFTRPVGKQRTWSFMMNGLVDLLKNDNYYVSIGGGAGAVNVNINTFAATSTSPNLINDYNWVFAWQGLAEAGFALSKNVDMTVGYRYLRSNKIDLASSYAFPVSTRLNNHTALVGLRLKLQRETAPASAPPPPPPAPPPPPPPAAAEAPAPAPAVVAAPMIVFFDFNSIVVTTEARTILRQVAERYRSTGQASLTVDGYTDKSGSDAYNQVLSDHRAQAVKRELIKLGITTDAIVTSAHGKERPRIETADGVREPQNRRVEINLR